MPPPGYGGTEAVIDVKARALAQAGHEVLLFTTGDSTCPVTRQFAIEHAPGVHVGGSTIELHHVVAAHEACRAFGADVIHDHTVLGPLLADRASAPVVTTNHGPFEDATRTYLGLIANAGVPIIAISHHQASTAGDLPVAAVIHHGVDVDRFPRGSGSGGYALFLGRMTETKGAETAIHAARHAGVPLVIAAKMQEPDEFRYFHERVEPLLGGDVTMVGEVGGEQKLGMLASAMCLLNPIAWPEPFGMVMIEAMACGTPVIATPCGSVPEIVVDGRTGYLAAGVEDLAAALAKIAAIDRNACRAEVESRFSSQRLAADHLTLYQTLISGT